MDGPLRRYNPVLFRAYTLERGQPRPGVVEPDKTQVRARPIFKVFSVLEASLVLFALLLKNPAEPVMIERSWSSRGVSPRITTCRPPIAGGICSSGTFPNERLGRFLSASTTDFQLLTEPRGRRYSIDMVWREGQRQGRKFGSLGKG